MSPKVITSSAQNTIVELESILERPLATSLSCSFIALRPESATSTIATLMAKEFARHGSDRALLVETATSPSSAARTLRQTTPPDSVLKKLPQQTQQWLLHREGVNTLSLPNATATDWSNLVAPITKNFDVIATDWGTRSMEDALEHAHDGQIICLTSSYERDSAEAALALSRTIADAFDMAKVMLVLSDLTNTRSTWPKLISKRFTFPIITIPFDRSLRNKQQANHTTMLSIRRAAALLVDEQVMTAEGGLHG